MDSSHPTKEEKRERFKKDENLDYISVAASRRSYGRQN
jgi:hypothetical protein